MRSKGQVVFAVAIAAVAAWALLETRGWSIKTALYPRVIGVPLLLLALSEAVLSVRGRAEAEPAGPQMDVALSGDANPAVTTRRTIAIFAWIAAFFLGIVALGFPVAVPAFTFAYLTGQARERWLRSLVLSALAWLIFSQLFIRLLHIPFAPGRLWGLFT